MPLSVALLCEVHGIASIFYFLCMQVAPNISGWIEGVCQAAPPPSAMSPSASAANPFRTTLDDDAPLILHRISSIEQSFTEMRIVLESMAKRPQGRGCSCVAVQHAQEPRSSHAEPVINQDEWDDGDFADAVGLSLSEVSSMTIAV